MFQFITIVEITFRAATQKDCSLWGVTDMSRMVCVKSSINGLWMRAMVVKEQSESTVSKHLWYLFLVIKFSKTAC